MAQLTTRPSKHAFAPFAVWSNPRGLRVLCGDGRCMSYVHAASTKDLVGTFDPVEDIQSVGTVKEQDELVRCHWAKFEKRIKSQNIMLDTCALYRVR